MATALIGIGSNLGDGPPTVRRGLALLNEHSRVQVTRCSRIHRTDPIGGPADQEAFVNAAAVLRSSLSPEALLTLLQDMEERFGRTRGPRWGPRTLDLDLLLFDDQVIESEVLQLPHPRMTFRRFVLEPAAEIAAEFDHPVCGMTIGELLDELNTQPDYVAIGGPPAAGKTALARWLQASLGCPVVLEPPPPESAASDAGPHLAAELELCERRAKLISPRQWWDDLELRKRLCSDRRGEPPREVLPAAVSDFWFAQAGVIASLNQPEPEASLAERRPYYALLGCLSHFRYRLLTRKLLIWLDPPIAPLADRLCAAGYFRGRETAMAYAERFRQHVSGVLGTLVRGPLLHLETDDLERIKTEAAAALQAIQPINGTTSD